MIWGHAEITSSTWGGVFLNNVTAKEGFWLWMASFFTTTFAAEFLIFVSFTF